MKKQITNFNLGTGEYMINGVRYIVCGKFEDFKIKKYSDSNHLNNRLKKHLMGDFAELSFDSINDKMTDEYDCSTVVKED
ncbi:hypothetical protein H8R91_07010 [Ruminococcus sp. NSJ-71]|uniref:GIY-YIG nuclease family protein n=1 Tax=Ruminococcus intestinalis TaxID=2763066 RepID=A0ABR7HLB2_9FIRM|nr:hypothetical protein [Ruminococcus intestinalis]MBC5728267.1 hypothetical protein [Ruminococcus intestinalis]